MKLAGTSRSFEAAFDRGDLTQLEFLDLAARELRVDGVVLDERHFPRTDDDYLAQVKKMAVDYGLCIAALESGSLLAGTSDLAPSLALAAAIGAPILTAGLSSETERSWSEQAERLSEVTRAAKRANVTVAVRNLPGSFAASSSECKRVAKEADSAWLRFALDPAAFDASSSPEVLAERTVLLYVDGASAPEPFFETWQTFGGFVVVGSNEQSAHRRWRHALASFVLNRT